MTRTESTVCTPLEGAPVARGWRGTVGALIETTKPGITRLVTITAGVGLGMALAERWAAGDRNWQALDIARIVAGCLLGTALSAGGSNALNQWWERGRDALMPRTERRPLPSGRLAPRQVLGAGLVLTALGVLVLGLSTGVAPALVALVCALVYVLVYTPMKAQTWLATLVGAVPGALPPLIGWSAGSPGLGLASLVGPGGLSLFALMFVWQLPHFLAIAWMYRDDYAAGGCPVLPVVDRSGRATAFAVAVSTTALIPATLAPRFAMPGVLGWVYLCTALFTGLAFAILAARLVIQRDRASARTTFFASIIHLPLLLMVMTVEAFVRAAS